MVFYVYALIDPRTNKPFYIGKGSGNRCYTHLAESYERSDNKRKWHAIRKIREAGVEPIVERWFESACEEDVFSKECEYIAQYGRIGFETNGILTNLSMGGDGPSGYKHTPETRALLSEKAKQQKRGSPSEETRRKISEATKGRVHLITDERREANRQAALQTWQRPDRGPAASRSLGAITHRKKAPEEIEKIRSKLKGRVVPPDERERMLANKPPMTEEYKAKISASKKGKPWSEARRAAHAASKERT